jgi:hypothetical protein
MLRFMLAAAGATALALRATTPELVPRGRSVLPRACAIYRKRWPCLKRALGSQVEARRICGELCEAAGAVTVSATKVSLCFSHRRLWWRYGNRNSVLDSRSRR